MIRAEINETENRITMKLSKPKLVFEKNRVGKFLARLIFLNDVYLIHKVLISAIQQSDSVIHIYILFYIPFLYVYYRILNIVPSAIQ